MLNRELAVINMGKEFGRAHSLGLDLSQPQAICHRFFVPSGELSDLVKRLRSDGFKVYEAEDAPAIEARRCEILEHHSLEILVRGMCDLGDKFAAEYDGWTLDH